MKLSQINSAKMLEQGNSMQYWTHIPSTLPYKCAINLRTYSSMLGLLYQFPFLDGTSHQMSYPMDVDVHKLFTSIIFAYHCNGRFFLFKLLFNKSVNTRLEVISPPMWR